MTGAQNNGEWDLPVVSFLEGVFPPISHWEGMSVSLLLLLRNIRSYILPTQIIPPHQLCNHQYGILQENNKSNYPQTNTRALILEESTLPRTSDSGRSMTGSPLILCLPTELIQIIGKFLLPESYISLALSHSIFWGALPILPLDISLLDGCAQCAIRGLLSVDRTRQRCALCKEVYPVELFDTPGKAERDRKPQNGLSLIEVPPTVCGWHRGRLCRVVVGTNKRGWTSCVDELCLHCGFVRAWVGCGCKCQSCSVVPVRTYTRSVGKESEFLTFEFWRRLEPAGQEGIWVRETGKDGDISNLPVYCE